MSCKSNDGNQQLIKAQKGVEFGFPLKDVSKTCLRLGMLIANTTEQPIKGLIRGELIMMNE